MSAARKTLFARRRKIISALILILFALHFSPQAQVKKPDKKNAPAQPVPVRKKGVKLSVGGTWVRTHFRNNFGTDFNASTYEGRLYFGDNGLVRGVINVENQPPVDLKPEWLQVHSLLIDLQGHIISYFRNRKGIVYVILGPSYQSFSGVYTGYRNITQLMPYAGRNYHANYFGGLFGIGIEFQLYQNISFYLEGRIRFLFNNETPNPNNRRDDVVYDQACIGLKVNLPEIHKIFRKPNDKYHWF